MFVSILAAALDGAPVRDLRSHELLSSVAISGTCARGCQGEKRVFGTGEIVGRQRDGRLVVLTAKHVIDDIRDPHVFVRNGEPEGTRIASAVRDGSGTPANVLAKSPDSDLALVSFRPSANDAYDVVSFSSENVIRSGDVVGGPYGALWTVSPYRSVESTDGATLVWCATCGPGDSGGGVFDRDGALAGILVAQQVFVEGDQPVASAKRSSRFKIVALDDVRTFVASVPPETGSGHDAWSRFDRATNAPAGVTANVQGDPWSRFNARRGP